MIEHEYDAAAKELRIRFLSAGTPRTDEGGFYPGYGMEITQDEDGNAAGLEVRLDHEKQPWPLNYLFSILDSTGGWRISDEDKALLREKFPDRMTSPYMSWDSDVPEGAVCENCGDHPAAPGIYAPGGIMDANHGHFKVWCDCCILREAVKEAEESAARLPELRSQLEAACR